MGISTMPLLLGVPVLEDLLFQELTGGLVPLGTQVVCEGLHGRPELLVEVVPATRAGDLQCERVDDLALGIGDGARKDRDPVLHHEAIGHLCACARFSAAIFRCRSARVSWTGVM